MAGDVESKGIEQILADLDALHAAATPGEWELDPKIRHIDATPAWEIVQRDATQSAALQVAREALEIAEKEIRIAAVMLSQVEPSAAVTVKESDRLHLASDKMCVVSDLSRKALARIEEDVNK